MNNTTTDWKAWHGNGNLNMFIRNVVIISRLQHIVDGALAVGWSWWTAWKNATSFIRLLHAWLPLRFSYDFWGFCSQAKRISRRKLHCIEKALNGFRIVGSFSLVVHFCFFGWCGWKTCKSFVIIPTVLLACCDKLLRH